MSNHTMNLHELMGVAPLGVSTEHAGLMLGSGRLFEKMISKGWIKPVVSQHRLRLWDRRDVERCWNRLKGGETLD
ncbi:MAG: hypothetical protein ACOYMV_00985 [Verrucomicrobiia bacterium]